jgi:cyclophilin family peptidyl-prolyl cis-trans isomerase
MKKYLALAAVFALSAPIIMPVAAQDAEQKGAQSPGQIVDAAPASDWVAIAAEDLLVMTLAADTEGNPIQVVIQLMPAPFSQGWIDNIRTLAGAKWWDGTSINRVQDNYVVQWGDASEEKPLPEGLKVMGERDYVIEGSMMADTEANWEATHNVGFSEFSFIDSLDPTRLSTGYADEEYVFAGWPFAANKGEAWPTHCYGMVGVARNYSPDTGTGAELYTVIGHAPRHLDRNIALVGRVIEGMEHLSSLPRGKGELGFYGEDELDKRVSIVSIRMGNSISESDAPAFEYLSTESETFARYADARANRRDPFFIVPAGGADICNIPVPIRRVVAD